MILQKEVGEEFLTLSDIKKLQEVSEEYDIPLLTLKTRLKLKSFNLIENVEYRNMGKGQSILLSPMGGKKITKK
ncbi:hypothetical protein [uncultured Clostridium sp.]|uniref:hypothetical protein n=1 Tax=uncultured Clostridium sp. TaxID=59620 RepID=UPI0028E844F9|nr:hypothetical protein [uncultured Clostridium sp.]